MILAQNAALDAHILILEDGPELHKVPGAHAEERGEILESMYTQGCSSLRDSKISRRERGLGTVSGTSPDPAGIVSKDPRVVPA
jgi:hypothetical protein